MGSYVGGDADGANGTSIAPVWPTTQPGDTALVLWTMSNVSLPDTVTGFTNLHTYTTNNPQTLLYYRICNGTETGGLNLALQAGDTATRMSAVLWVGRGFHPTSPIDGFSFFRETVSGTTHDCPAYTLVAANCGVAVLVAERSTTGTNDWTAPTGFASNHLDSLAQATGSGGTITAIASDDLATTRSAGASVDPGVWTSANAFASTNVNVYTVALAPAPPNTVNTFVRPVQSPLQIIR